MRYPREGVLKQALNIKGRGIITLPPLQLLVTRMRPPGTVRSLQIQQTASWENWQKPAKGDSCYRSWLLQIYLRGAWSRGEGKISHCSFLSEFRLAGKTLVIVRFFPRTAIASLLVSFCVLRTWLGNYLVGGPPDIARRKSGLHPICGWGPTDCCPLSGELSKSLFLLAVFGSDFGSWEGSIFCTLFGDVSYI